MKKWMMLLLALVLCLPVMAEENLAVPVEIVEERAQNHIQVGLSEAIAKAQAEIPTLPEQYQTRAEVVRMSDDSYRWVVTVFDLATLTDGWCVELDVSTGEVIAYHTTNDGFFLKPLEYWAGHKGGSTDKRLWTIEEKAIFDALYALQPMYGLPQPGDISRDEAVERANAALAPYYPQDRTTGYLICPGYLMGGEGVNGIWEIYFKEKDLLYQVNLDAVTGEIYYISADDNGNG